MKPWLFPILVLSAAAPLLSCRDAVPGPTLVQAALEAEPEAPATVWVLLKDQRAPRLNAATARNWQARGREVVRQLTERASGQADLRAWLAARGVAHRSFWIVNALRLTADRATIDEIARRPEVAQVQPDRQLPLPARRREDTRLRPAAVEWGVGNTRAPEVWSNFNDRGENIVVATIDTGVQFDHPALVRQYRGNQGGGSFDHNYNWFDPAGTCGPGSGPCDDVSHGTHTMGSLVGDDGDPGDNQIGVAPRARWITAKGCENFGCTLESLIASGQWLLAPTDLSGQNPAPDRRPHVVSNSWGGGGGDPFFNEILQAWAAAGIFSVFSVGGEGPGCATAGSPADSGDTYAVGAHDIDNAVASFSSRGPAGLLIKPNITAPGVMIRSSVPGGGFEIFSGTSMATPHVAGAVALIWSAAPTLIGDLPATRALLDGSAIDTPDLSCGGTPGNNNVYGEGRLDAFAAVEGSPRGPTGTVQGTVTDANDGQPVADVEVRALQNEVAVRTTRTDSTGGYRMQLPVGSYVIEAGGGAYERAQSPVEVVLDQTARRDFVLPTARAEVTPATVELVMPVDQTRTRTLSLRNTGTAELRFQIGEAGGQLQAVVSSARARPSAAADPNASTTAGLLEPGLRPQGWASSAPGQVVRSFRPDSALGAYGLSFAGNLWVSDLRGRTNHEYNAVGGASGRNWTTAWSNFPADMAHDAGRNLVCQVNAGGDNGIHCWNPDSGALAASITGSLPWTATSQRGLAYRPDDDSFYVGGWNDGTIYHIKGLSQPDSGAVIGQCTPADRFISGLAWNGSMKVLWAATNSQTDSIYELNPDDCTVLSVLPHPAGGGFQGGGLELDASGDLWMVSQPQDRVFLVESGVPAFSDVPWLNVSPAQGTVAAGGQNALAVTIDSKGLAAGTYLASIFVTSNSGREAALRIPVSLVVSDYQQGVNAGGGSYTDRLGDTWAADRQHRNGSWGYVQRSSTRSTSHDISGTADPKLYQSQRIDPYAYRFDAVPNGVYQVDLRFAELEKVNPGKRTFDVIVENTLVLPSHDVAFEVGRHAADHHTFFIEVADGRMDIRLIPNAGHEKPTINALRITRRPDR